MPYIPSRHASFASALAVALSSLTLLAEGPRTPEPKVVATIEQPAKQGGACLVRAEIRDPQSDEVLSAPNIQLLAGQEATASTSESDRKVEVTVKAGPGCAGGTYAVSVWSGGKLVYSKSGALKPKA